MERLIDDLLTLARQEEELLERESVPVASLTENCWGTVETGRATLEVDTALTIRADRTRLKQAIENLIRNAIEHGGASPTVRVGDLPDGFFVADDGPGISEDIHDEIFTSGYSTAEEGTGFGLAIVREIVEAHDWEISVVDSTDGGARFEITGVEIVDS
jgi:signal transduction histidine kinase